MGAICEDCGQDMMNSNGCIYTHAIKVGTRKQVLRDIDNICHQDRCHDCNAQQGHPHHFGCDNEHCPFCGSQAAFCGCFKSLAKKRRKS